MTLEVATILCRTIVLKWHANPTSRSSLADLFSCISRCSQVFQRHLVSFRFWSWTPCYSFLVLNCCCPGNRSPQLIQIWCPLLLLRLHHLPNHADHNLTFLAFMHSPPLPDVWAAACPSAMSRWELCHDHPHSLLPSWQKYWNCDTGEPYDVRQGRFLCVTWDVGGWCCLADSNFSDDCCHWRWLGWTGLSLR